jgi:hypothetical protein
LGDVHLGLCIFLHPGRTTRVTSPCTRANRILLTTFSMIGIQKHQRDSAWESFAGPCTAGRGAYGRMRQPVDIRPWGPRFIYGNREDNLYDSRCPSRRAPVRPYARVRKPHRRPPGRAFDSVGRGREGGLPMELYLLHPAFCLCYQKPPPPVLSCPSRTRSKASAPACSHAPGLRCRKLLRRPTLQ